jgi:hypothetical protein
VTSGRPEAPSVELAHRLAAVVVPGDRGSSDAISRVPAPFCLRADHASSSDVTRACRELSRRFEASLARRELAPAATELVPAHAGKDAPLRLLQPTRRHVHHARSFEARGRASGLRLPPPRPSGPRPRRASRVMERLTTPRELGSSELHACPTRGGEVGRAPILRVLDRIGPSGCAPRGAALSSAREESSSST